MKARAGRGRPAQRHRRFTRAGGEAGRPRSRKAIGGILISMLLSLLITPAVDYYLRS
jgi:hypothetical protein